MALEEEIAGRPVIAYVTGSYMPYNVNSKLYKAIVAAGYTVMDIGVKIDIAVEGKREYKADGYRMAVVKLKGGDINEDNQTSNKVGKSNRRAGSACIR